jgi:hypothetical protein
MPSREPAVRANTERPCRERTVSHHGDARTTPPEGDERAVGEPPERAIAGEIEVECTRPEQHGIEGVGEHDEPEQDSRRGRPSRPLPAVREEPIARIQPTDGEGEGERTDDAARREMPGEHGGTARDDHGGQAGLPTRAEDRSAQEVSRNQGEDHEHAGQDARDRERRDAGVEQRGEQVESQRRIREGDPAGSVAGDACGEGISVRRDGVGHREEEPAAERGVRDG